MESKPTNGKSLHGPLSSISLPRKNFLKIKIVRRVNSGGNGYFKLLIKTEKKQRKIENKEVKGNLINDMKI